MPPSLATAPPELAAPVIPIAPAFLWKISIIGGLSGILYGYDSGIVSSAGPYFNQQFNIPDVGTVTNVIVSSSTSAHHRRLPRRRTNRRLSSAADSPSSTGLSYLHRRLLHRLLRQQHPHPHRAHRFVLGASIGFTSVTAPVYLCELAPPHLRGRLVGFYQLYFTLGMALASVVGYMFTTSETTGNWHAMFGVGLPSPPPSSSSSSSPSPKSPRWLVAKGQDRKSHRPPPHLHHPRRRLPLPQ